MTRQFLRTCVATVNGVEVRGGGNTDLRVRFDVHQRVTGTPHHINLYLTNLSAATIAKMRKEGGSVRLTAGYEDGSGLIFEGTEILQVRTFRENVTDTVVHVLATSGGSARNYAVVNKSLASGHNYNDRVKAALEAFKPLGITPGQIDELSSKKFPRGFAYSGMAKDLLREVCEAAQATWHIQGSKLHILKTDKTLSGNTAVINADTGMVGLPEQTLQGVVVRCLLNPTIYPGSRIQLNNSSVQQATLSADYGSRGNNELLKDGGLLGLAPDGIYKALKVEHSGDTRGGPWYTDIICVALGSDSIALRRIGISTDDPQDEKDYSGTGG